MLPVHTFQQYRAFALRQETGIHRLIHGLAVGIDVGCEGRVAKSERHHADLGEMYLHSVGPMPDLPFKGYGKLFRHPTAVRRGVGGFRVAKHLHRPVTHDKQAEIAGRKRDDALVGERTERFWDGLIRRRVVLLSTAGELDVAVDRDDATDATQSETVVRVWRFPLLGYGKLSSWNRIAERADATLIAASGSHVRASNGSVRIDDEHSRRLPVGDAHHRIDFDRRAQFGGQHVFALH